MIRATPVLLLLVLVPVSVVKAAYVNPFPLSTSPVWKPKDATYDPRNKDWSGVASACKAIGSVEKRVLTYFVYMAFHGGMAVDVKACSTAATAAACGGADSWLLLDVKELTRATTTYEDYKAVAGRAAIKVASFFNTSVADVVAVCSAVAVEQLSSGRVKILGGKDPAKATANFRVGRTDLLAPTPPAALPTSYGSSADFASFWGKYGFTAEHAVALIGAHGLSSSQGCLLDAKNYCDPLASPNCTTAVRQFKWANHFFHDACTPSTVVATTPPQTFSDLPLTAITLDEFKVLASKQSCKFTSPDFRSLAVQRLGQQAEGHVPEETRAVEPVVASWVTDRCEKGAAYGALSCPHTTNWPFSTSDAYLAQVCQAAKPTASYDQSIQQAMRKFLKQTDWDKVVPDAWLKMLNTFAKFSTIATSSQILINGRECTTAYAADLTCAAASAIAVGSCDKCAKGDVCPSCCRCPNAFSSVTGYALRQGTAMPPVAAAAPPPPSPAIIITGDPTANVTVNTTPIPAANPTGTAFAGIPPSPYNIPNDACSGKSISVNGFPSSPFAITPFTRPFSNPGIAQKSFTTCLPDSPKTCVDVYDQKVVETQLDLGLGCGKTTFLAYNGTVPGPTVYTRMGRQTLVRFTNLINPNSATYPPHAPCVGSRSGRPISIHHHGSASLAPYDGWAEDSTCYGEVKDYLYPNNRPGTGWYHDHELDITADNAHAGMAGMYIVRNSTDTGTGPDRWGLDEMEEYHLILADKVFNSACQMRLETQGVHLNSHYGDVNLVSGIPFPKLSAQPKWVRFRILSAAVTRPWLLSLVDQKGTEVSSKICKVIAGDGGYRQTPIDFPADGLFMGVAERYELACNFGDPLVAGKTLYLWNTQDQNRMKDVPFFCYSHLVMKIDIAATCTPRTDHPNDCTVALWTSLIPTHVDHVITQTEYDLAVAQAQAGRCDRKFVFGRGGGQWVVNGETWETVRLAAADIPVNSHEIWCLEAGGGWFHPIHIHLIDMFVLLRKDSGSYRKQTTYETHVPKDVVQLHPGSQVAVMARWGPHRGEYMFHCHNLRHEDNEMMRSLSTDNPYRVDNNDDPAFNTLSIAEFKNGLNQTTYTMYDDYRDPVYPNALAKPIAIAPPLNVQYAQALLAHEMYRIFYPGTEDRSLLCDRTKNPWLVEPAETCE